MQQPACSLLAALLFPIPAAPSWGKKLKTCTEQVHGPAGSVTPAPLFGCKLLPSAAQQPSVVSCR